MSAVVETALRRTCGEFAKTPGNLAQQLDSGSEIAHAWGIDQLAPRRQMMEGRCAGRMFALGSRPGKLRGRRVERWHQPIGERGLASAGLADEGIALPV